MMAFVKTTKGTFPNQNFYLAWKGWNDMGYQVHLFEEEDLDGTEIWRYMTKETPVFAGVTVFERVLKALDVDYHHPGTYPYELRKFMAREVKESTMGAVRKEFLRTEISVFVKPVKQKVFNGDVLKNTLSLIQMAKVPDDCPVYVSEPIEFLSEFRVYIQEDEILAAKHYAGDWTKLPDPEVIKSVMKTWYYHKPVTYALDFGVVKRPLGNITALVEFNDATSLGNYGLEAMNYAEMLTQRWFEIMETSKKERLYKDREAGMITQETFIKEYESKSL
jgi:hypothetical protein